MSRYSKVLIILKDAPNHTDYNKRILEYLNDRYTAINDNMFSIAIDVADDSNINEFALKGIESVPAMHINKNDSFIYGVNSILATLAKLEIIDNDVEQQSQNNKQGFVASSNANQDDSQENNAFYDMVMEEMKCDDQEDNSPSTLKAYNQESLESPLNEKSIEEKAKAYNKIYDQRRNRNGGKAGPKQTPRRASNDITPSGINVDNFIAKGGYDKGEELFMRQIAQNL